MNYVRSQALQPPSRSRTGSAHCEVIFCSYCADRPMHGFSTHFQNAHTHKSRFERALRSQVLRIRLSRWITIQNAIFSHFKSLIWKNFAFTKGKIRLSNQERVRITIRNRFRNVIRSFANRPNEHPLGGKWSVVFPIHSVMIFILTLPTTDNCIWTARRWGWGGQTLTRQLEFKLLSSRALESTSKLH